ncbi:uncharacterized protein LOC129611096 [Condylostylus longicornis]|uniref:uncharacterized protein LOC129611096 n=1 Tax=Condylostylus longicornis TaxID=2530218 RepID=UPI00244DA935|nr:uncharacterized protein LOC129611096 [Condylostylus longicornis]
MDFKWKFLIISLIVTALIQRVHCLKVIDAIDVIDLSTDSSLTEDDNILVENRKEKNNKLEPKTLDESSNHSTTTEKSTEASKTAMDIITIVWYTSTFLALAAFFFLMACSDRRCGRHHDQNSLYNRNRHNSTQCPPSPAPSYREFAPPSYESVIKKAIYVIPIENNIKLVSEKEIYSIEGETVISSQLQQQQQQSLPQQSQQHQQQPQQQQNVSSHTKLEIVNEYSNNEQSKAG